MAKRARTLRTGEPRVQWTTRNLPPALLAEMRAIAALAELLPTRMGVEAVANMGLELGLPLVRRAIERQVAKLP